jgi:hypothetical protein
MNRGERRQGSLSNQISSSVKGPPKADGELMQALFDESAVVAEACGDEGSSTSSMDSLEDLEE